MNLQLSVFFKRRTLFGFLLRGALIVFLSLVALELALRAIGSAAVYKLRSAYSKSVAGSTVVLCAGDSFVWGAGGRPFPDQLQEILDKKAGQGKFRVLNVGYPGTGTTIALKKLPEQMVLNHSDILIFLSGSSNVWRETDVQEEKFLMRFAVYRLFRQVRMADRDHRYSYLVSDVLPAIKRYTAPRSRSFYELSTAAILMEGSNYVMPDVAYLISEGARKYPDNYLIAKVGVQVLSRMGRYGEAERIVGNYSESNPRHYTLLARFLAEKREYAAALQSLEKIVHPDKGLSEEINLISGRIYELSGDYAGEIECYSRELSVTRNWYTVKKISASLGVAYSLTGNIQKARDAYETSVSIFPRYEPGPLKELAKLYSGIFDPKIADPARAAALRGDYEKFAGTVWTLGKEQMDAFQNRIHSDYESVAELAARYGVSLILSSYPEKSFPGVISVAGERNVPYIDFIPIFAQRFSSRREWVSYDNSHCNTAGYRVMAEEYANKILEICPGGACRAGG